MCVCHFIGSLGTSSNIPTHVYLAIVPSLNNVYEARITSVSTASFFSTCVPIRKLCVGKLNDCHWPSWRKEIWSVWLSVKFWVIIPHFTLCRWLGEIWDEHRQFQNFHCLSLMQYGVYHPISVFYEAAVGRISCENNMEHVMLCLILFMVDAGVGVLDGGIRY